METPSLFDEPRGPVTALVVKAKAIHPLGPWFDAIAAEIGPLAAKNASGRVAKIAKQMRAAGLPPERVREIGSVVQRYAKWRKVLDLNAVQECWAWILEPPQDVSGSGGMNSLELMATIKAVTG
jgi:hypothetical protein